MKELPFGHFMVGDYEISDTGPLSAYNRGYLEGLAHGKLKANAKLFLLKSKFYYASSSSEFCRTAGPWQETDG